MLSNCAKCGQQVEAETLGECAHFYCTPCQKLILATLGFDYEKEQRRYNRMDIQKEANAAMRCPICYKSKICQNCQNIFISKNKNLNFCKDCVTNPTKEAITALKIGYGLQKSHNKHLFPRCKSCDQVYDFNRRNPLKLSCSCTICADCYGQNCDNCCSLCKKQWEEEANVETNQVIVDEIGRILSAIKKNEEDCVLICTECAKEDVETDMNVCKDCAMEKFGYDVDSEEVFENIDALAICSTCALKKHLPKNHKIADFYPLRSKSAMKATRKILATKLGEIENKVTGFDSTWDRMSHLVSKTKVELEKMMAIMENSKNTHDRNLVIILYEKNAKKVVEFLDAINGGFGDMLEKLNVTFNELFAQNLHFSLKNDILSNNSSIEMSNISLPLNYEEDQKIVIREKTAEKPKEDVPVIVRRDPMTLSAPPATKKMRITKHIPPSYHYPSSSSSAIRHVVPIQAAPRGYMPVYARPFVPNPLPQIQIRHPPPIGVRRNVVVKQNPKNCQG